mgnify:CR=1 FL=1
MADITSSVAEKPIGRSGESLGYWVSKKVTPVGDGVSATGAHTIIDIPANSFVSEGYVVVTTACTSGGSLTAKFGTGSKDYSATIPVANLAANDFVKLQIMDYEDTDGGAGYSTSADTFDMTVATAAFTAGVFYIAINIVDLISE